MSDLRVQHVQTVRFGTHLCIRLFRCCMAISGSVIHFSFHEIPTIYSRPHLFFPVTQTVTQPDINSHSGRTILVSFQLLEK
jgi:hypothetical protein